MRKHESKTKLPDFVSLLCRYVNSVRLSWRCKHTRKGYNGTSHRPYMPFSLCGRHACTYLSIQGLGKLKYIWNGHSLKIYCG